MANQVTLMQQSYTVPPAANAGALDSAIASKINTLSKAYQQPGDPIAAGVIVPNSILITGFTVIITSADVITYTAQIVWYQYVMQS